MKYLYANLKTNFTTPELEQYLTVLTRGHNYPNHSLVFLNHLYVLGMAKQFGSDLIGVQSFDTNEMGAYTSSVSYQQLQKEGIKHVLLGHSEEMKYFDKTLDDVNCQLKIALENGFQPVVCLGEEENDHFIQRMNEIEEQLQIILNEIETGIDQVIFAYEPKWAIGNQAMEAEDIFKTVQSIKSFVYDQTGENVRVLYGGSVNCQNIHTILDNDIVDGVLIGSAALNVDNYLAMLNEQYNG